MGSFVVGGAARWAVALGVAAVLVAGASAGDREYASVMAWDKLQVYERGDNGKLRHRSFDPDKRSGPSGRCSWTRRSPRPRPP